jgi:uncharacterized membrane-anchored protein YitT (DUF2179 family)
MISDIILVLTGNFILALAVHTFILPYEILSGGVAGIAVAVSRLTEVRADVIVIVLVIGLYLLGSFFLGRKFIIHTASSSFLYPFFLTFLSTQNVSVQLDPILASIYGGLVAGFGVGLVMRTGASTGGMDVPPLIIHKFTHIELSKLILVVDICTVALGTFVYGIEAVLMGFVSVYATAFAVNRVLVFGSQQARSVMIISERPQAVVEMIDQKLERGSTLLHGTGGYTKKERPVVLTVINMGEYPRLIQELDVLDPHAFVVANEAMEVKGNGFSFDYKV